MLFHSISSSHSPNPSPSKFISFTRAVNALNGVAKAALVESSCVDRLMGITAPVSFSLITHRLCPKKRITWHACHSSMPDLTSYVSLSSPCISLGSDCHTRCSRQLEHVFYWYFLLNSEISSDMVRAWSIVRRCDAAYSPSARNRGKISAGVREQQQADATMIINSPSGYASAQYTHTHSEISRSESP